MKTTKLLVAGVAIAAGGWLSGCASTEMIARAEGTTSRFSEYDTSVRHPNPAYYALVPLTLPYDIVTLPIQYYIYRSDL